MRISSVLGLIYIIVGVAVAASHEYFQNVDRLKPIISAVLAVLLWPLVLVDVDLHID